MAAFSSRLKQNPLNLRLEWSLPVAEKNCHFRPLPRIQITMSQEKATFGAGCFWGVEAAFAAIPGVAATAAGYEGGSLERPSYKDVCTDQTGHAEVVEVDFDPEMVSFEQLLDAFFALHDPTTLNRQGPDWGTQYRSAIFFHSQEQEAQAHAKIGPNLLARRGVPPALPGKARPGKLPHLAASEQTMVHVAGLPR
jgi:peptide-methionine (S)-S-oxide reductase